MKTCDLKKINDTLRQYCFYFFKNYDNKFYTRQIHPYIKTHFWYFMEVFLHKHLDQKTEISLQMYV